jgi:hypothetical protein
MNDKVLWRIVSVASALVAVSATVACTETVTKSSPSRTLMENRSELDA